MFVPSNWLVELGTRKFAVLIPEEAARILCSQHGGKGMVEIIAAAESFRDEIPQPLPTDDYRVDYPITARRPVHCAPSPRRFGRA